MKCILEYLWNISLMFYFKTKYEKKYKFHFESDFVFIP